MNKLLSEREIDFWKIQYRNDTYYVVNEAEPYSGKVTSFHKNGQLERDLTCINGQLEGLFRMWYANGQLRVEKTYANRKQEGLERWWREEGWLSNEFTYVNGNKDGQQRTWDENGQLKSEATWVNGEFISGWGSSC